MSCANGKKLNKYVSDYVVFDLETTGVSVNSDDVVEISAIKVNSGIVVDEFTSLVNPGRPIPYYASAVNGITDDMVENYPSFDIVLKEFLDFAGDYVLVGHNIHSFDMKFIYRDAERFLGKTITNDYVDTLPLSRVCLPNLPSHSLVNLACHYGIATDGAHRALNDCRMNQKVFEALGEEMESPSSQIRICSCCGSFLKKRNGRYGEFWGCSSYPDCKHTEKI